MKVKEITVPQLQELAELKSAQDDLFAKYTAARNAYDARLKEIADPGKERWTLSECGRFIILGQGGNYFGGA